MIMGHLRNVYPPLMLAVFAFSSTGVSAATGEQIYGSSCVACHAAGVLGAPKLGVQADWARRSEKGLDELAKSAINGINSMPPKGGNPALSDDEVRSVVVFMLDKLEGSAQLAEAIAELQWRLSPAIMVIVLGLLAIPLAHSEPREGRGARVVLGILVYILYGNLLYLCRTWVIEGVLPASIGMWWVHVVFLIISFAWIRRQGRFPIKVSST